MDYLLLMLILGGLSACVIAAYELFDAIERDDYERSSAWSRHARVAVVGAGPSSLPVPHSTGSSVPQGGAIPVERGVSLVRHDPEQFDLRIRGLETRLERLESEYQRISVAAVRAPTRRATTQWYSEG